MNRCLAEADQWLRPLPRIGREDSSQDRVGLSLMTMVVFSGAYGAVMGSFGGLAGDRSWQILFSFIKVPILHLSALVLCLPTYFVLNALFGLRDDFPKVLRGLLASQGAASVVLASLAPLTLLFYGSSDDYQKAVLGNGLMFLVAALAGQVVLSRHYKPLCRARPRHRLLIRIWLPLYGLAGVQMAWVLRPFVGNPGHPVQFFRPDPWSNAFEALWRALSPIWQ